MAPNTGMKAVCHSLPVSEDAGHTVGESSGEYFPPVFVQVQSVRKQIGLLEIPEFVPGRIETRGRDAID